MMSKMELKQLIDQKALASPVISSALFKADIRISFKRKGVKVSYLVSSKAECRFDMGKDDWGMFYRVTTMDNLHFFVPVDCFKTWLKMQVSGEDSHHLV